MKDKIIVRFEDLIRFVLRVPTYNIKEVKVEIMDNGFTSIFYLDINYNLEERKKEIDKIIRMYSINEVEIFSIAMYGTNAINIKLSIVK